MRRETPIRGPQPSGSMTLTATYLQLCVLRLLARDSTSDRLRRFGAFHPRQTLFTHEQPWSHDADAAARHPNEHQLQIGTFQDCRASSSHFIKRPINIARFELDSAAAVQDNVRVQSEVVGVERAVFDAVVQRQAHQVDVFDRTFLQVMGESGVPSMRVVKKRAVTINVSLDALVKT